MFDWSQTASGARAEGAVWQPRLFRLAIPEQREEMARLAASEPHIQVVDLLHAQLTDLARTRHPAAGAESDQARRRIEEQISRGDLASYGVAAYYPWSGRLVRILEEDDFIELRTNRNRNKITAREQRILRTKRIGVVGLSVGQAVAVTIAMERLAGELRLADFDRIELSNLNRIRCGVHNGGLFKVVVTAREIAEIDPFIKVRCFTEGVHPGNVEAFFVEGGKLDAVVEECDALDAKIEVREVARRLGVPVVMDTSDRGLVDVERFDQEPQRPILHGLVGDVTAAMLRTLTAEQRLAYVLRIIGTETMSARLKSSMPEIGKTLATWPQLASAVAHGGGMAADLVRRILLDQGAPSGRYFVDLQELTGGGSSTTGPAE